MKNALTQGFSARFRRRRTESRFERRLLHEDARGSKQMIQDKVALPRHTDAYVQDADEGLNFAFLNSVYQTGLERLLDLAVLARVDVVAQRTLKNACRRVDQMPFDVEIMLGYCLVATLMKRVHIQRNVCQ